MIRCVDAVVWTGTIPSIIAVMTKLQYLDLSSNCFSGRHELMQTIRMSFPLCNNAVGQLPTEFSQLRTVARLYISANRFTGLEKLLFSALFRFPLSNYSLQERFLPRLEC